MSISTPQSTPRTAGASVLRGLLLCGIFGPALLVTVFLIDGATRPGYNAVHQWVSHLSLGDRGWLGTANLAISGLLALAFAAGLGRVVHSRWAVRFAAGFGLGLIGAAIFPIDPGLGYPPGVPPAAGPSLTHMIHNVTGLMVFGSLIGLCFVMARWFRTSADGQAWARYSTITGVVIVVAYIATSTLVGMEYGGVLPGAPSGLMERVALIAGCLWMALFASGLVRNPSRME